MTNTRGLRAPLSVLTLVLALVGAATLAACGGGHAHPGAPAPEPTPGEAATGVEAEHVGEPTAQPSEEPAPASSAAVVTPPAPAYPKFSDMKAPERLEHMKKVVAPKMKTLFQEFDAKEFANFSCATCHGKGAKNGNFKMPNPELPKLDMSDKLAKQTKEHPEIMKFMMETVTHEMASLLGEEPYNPETHQGFGCLECHTKK